MMMATVAGLAVAGLVASMAWRFLGPAETLASAEEALAQHDLAAARSHLDRYRARWPNDPQALFLAAKAARRSDRCADAERFLTAFEQRFGPTDASRLEWALLGAQQGDFAGEEKRLQMAVSQDHLDALEIAEALAKGYAVSYRSRQALKTLDWLIERDPSHVPALLLRGTILDHLHRSDAAAADLRRAVECAPQDAAAHTALADVLNHLGHTREAIYHYELAQHFRTPNATTLLGLARAFSDASQLADAERRLDELLAADPDCTDGLVERGRVALRQGRPAEAEPFLARAVRVAPWHRDGQQLYLVVLKELGRREAASQCEARLAELRAEDAIGGRLKLRALTTSGASVRWDLRQWSMRNGQDEEGFAWLTEVLLFDPGHVQANAALADFFERAGQSRRAALHRGE
jgi:tetratricopeptide (TPR) repeat protein